MTQYYESEVLHRLMEREGFNIPSSVPKYESEIKAYLVEQVKLAYPKLTDYEAEWLLYNYTKHLPADFPISSATNVTNASFKDVVPFAYQTAILKGQTLVNLNVSEGTKTSPENQFFDFDMAYLQPNTTYTVIFDVSYGGTESAGIFGFLTTSKNDWNVKNTYAGSGSHKELLTTNSNIDLGVTLRIRRTINDGDFTVSNVMVVKGDHTQEVIPYFKGMQSVKMPVLTITGKNLFDISNLNATYIGVNEYKIPLNTKIIMDNFYENTVYTISGYFQNIEEGSNGRFRVNYYDGTYTNLTTAPVGEYIRVERTTNGKTIKNIMVVSSTGKGTMFIKNIQIEKDTKVTSYEPRKPNILTVNDDVELGSVGEVKDELNLLTGQLTQRTETRAYQEGDEANSEVITDMANTRYKLHKECIKTVELTTVNEKGEITHFMPLEGTMNVQSSGEIIQPTFNMSVPVEATTQNLASFIDLEMEE